MKTLLSAVSFSSIFINANTRRRQMPKTKDAVTSMTVLLFMIYIVIQIQHKFAVTALFLFLYCINSVGPIQFLIFILYHEYIVFLHL